MLDMDISVMQEKELKRALNVKNRYSIVQDIDTRFFF